MGTNTAPRKHHTSSYFQILVYFVASGFSSIFSRSPLIFLLAVMLSFEVVKRIKQRVVLLVSCSDNLMMVLDLGKPTYKWPIDRFLGDAEKL